MKDQHVEVEFLLGLRQRPKGKVTAFKIWTRSAPGTLAGDERVLRVKLQVPLSLWAYPGMKGRLESRLEEEFEAFLEEMKE